MPRVRLYDNQADLPDPTPRARFDVADAGAGGLAIAQAASRFGQQIGQYGDVLKQTRDHEEAAAVGLKFQQLLTDTDDYERGWQNGTNEDSTASGAGMSTSVLGRFDQGARDIESQIASKEIRDRFLLQASEHRRRYADRTAAAEDQKLGAYFSEQNIETVKLAANRVRESNDPADATMTISNLADTVLGYKIPEPDKPKVQRANSTVVKRAFLDGQIERNPRNALTLIDKGFAADLDPNLVDQYRDEAHAAIHALEAEERANRTKEQQILRDQLGAVEQSLNAGGGTVRDMLDLAEQYRTKLGDMSKAAEWQTKAAERQAVLGTKDATLPQLDAEIARLTAKQSSKDGLTGLEAATLNGLKDQRSQMAARLGQEGGAILQSQYATGKPPTPLDVRNPDAMRQRAREAEAAAGTYGRFAVEPLLPNEVAPLKDLVQSGDAAKQLQALNVISRFASPRSIIGAAQQIGGGNGPFRVAAMRSTMVGGREVAAGILSGKAALSANPGVWQRRNDDDKLVTAEDWARSIFAEYIPALAGLGANYADDTFEAAKAFYAARMTSAGKTEFEGGNWRGAIEAVISARTTGGVHYGGTAEFQGQRVAIPDGWTGEGLFRRIARASSQDWQQASGNRNPIWPDGSHVYTGQLRELIPVWMGGTTYAFRSPRTNNFLSATDGQPYTIDASKVPWK